MPVVEGRGSAGTPTAETLSVQGVVGGTAVPVSGAGTSMTDDAAFTVGSTAVVPAAGIFLGTRDLVDDGDAGAIAMTQRRGLFAVLESPNADSLVDDTADVVKVGGNVAPGGARTAAPVVIAGTDGSDLVRTISVNAQGKFAVRIADTNDSSLLSTQDPNIQADGVTSFLLGTSDWVFNGTTWDRQRGDVTTGTWVGGAIAHDSVDSGRPLKLGGRASVGVRTGVADADRVDAYLDANGRLVVSPGGANWTASHEPAANAQATATRAAAGAGVKNVCTSITAAISTNGVATAVQVYVRLIDGASGGATVLWRATLSISATAGVTSLVALAGLWIEGTANTAMTLEFSVAGGANTIETVAMVGTTVG